MRFRFQQTEKISNLCKQLDQKSYYIRQFPIQPEARKAIISKHLLKSAVFSAKIEGNPLKLEEINLGISSDKDKHQLEIENLIRAQQLVYSPTSPEKISLDFILELHAAVINSLRSDAGHLRKEQTAVFDSSGAAIYLAPPASDIKNLLNKLIKFTSESQNKYVTSAIAHFWFEKIHPFVDGNGRVGRLLSQYILDNRGESFSGLLSFEEQIESSKQEYYRLLAQEKNDITTFIEYFLSCLDSTAEGIVRDIATPQIITQHQTLLPRRQEILSIIKDHKQISFDRIRRRFLSIPTSTLHYDLRQLMKENLVRKIGKTRGALYEPAQ